MRLIYLTWLAICLSLPLAAQASNRYQPLPAGATGHTAKSGAVSTPRVYSAFAQPDSLAAAHSSKVLSRAVNMLGTPYRWGGSSPKRGFDCSGLVKYAFSAIDEVDLPRTSSAMSRAEGQKVARDELEPGDLLFFNIKSRRINHVAIYLGNDRFIHAPRRGKKVSIGDLNKPYWKRHYALAKRVLPETAPAKEPLRLSQR
ncbi:NlpC/P60 family protein [Pseudomonas cavernae]|uniref:NlpC/P60 family protein n=1 Tax=Pseudomonas cavernae TaxID=2320867 RepID=A0A385YWR7_9PSED|nr:C40 family peptidase [Pseudomonas cavernae]AYC31136.1 NlpC/P60 family protein [Pseudomonas cavernae]